MPADDLPTRAKFDPDWYLGVLEEYRSLRTEATTARDAQLSILRLAVPLLAALIGLGVSLRNGESLVAGLLLLAAVPAIAALTFEMWLGEIQRSVRAGSVVGAIEQRLGELFKGRADGPPMGWELWLRRPDHPPYPKPPSPSQQQHDSVVTAMVISAFLLLVALVSAALGFYFLRHNDYSAVSYAVGGTVVVSLLALVERARRAVRGLRHRNNVPKPADVWTPYSDESTKDR